jgi:hypothetical protein
MATISIGQHGSLTRIFNKDEQIAQIKAVEIYFKNQQKCIN